MRSSAAAVLTRPDSAPPDDLPPRVIAHVQGPANGPFLACLGSVHGNEPAGVHAAQRVAAQLAEQGTVLAGTFMALLGNRRAIAAKRRYLDHDLNRIWLPERLAERRNGQLLVEAEEAREILEVLDGASAGKPAHQIHVLDLHTTSGSSPAFAVVDDTLPNRDFALHYPVPIVLGLEEELSGTLLSFLTEREWVTMGFEGGQHDDPASVDRAEAAIWIALGAAGLLALDHPEVVASQALLVDASRDLPNVVELRYRHAITPADAFKMMPGFVSFAPVAKGQILGHDSRGEVRATEACRVLMPLYQAQGDDGFFLVRRVGLRWLELSKWLRRMRADRIVHWLPGVSRHPELDESWVVDRRVARWFAIELFHLLGFRHHGLHEQRVVVTRRV